MTWFRNILWWFESVRTSLLSIASNSYPRKDRHRFKLVFQLKALNGPLYGFGEEHTLALGEEYEVKFSTTVHGNLHISTAVGENVHVTYAAVGQDNLMFTSDSHRKVPVDTLNKCGWREFRPGTWVTIRLKAG